MKKYYLTCWVLILFGLFYLDKLNAQSKKIEKEGYAVLTVGQNGKSNGSSIGGEIGMVVKTVHLGLGLAEILTDEEWVLESKSGTYYTGVRIYSKKYHEYEGYGALGMMLLKNVFLVTTIGYSGETYKKKSESQYGIIDLGTKDGPGHMALSIRLQLEAKGFIIGAGYHNRRGIIGSIGFRFK
jgi:hypothetical protein